MKLTKGKFVLICSFIAVAIVMAIGCVIMNESDSYILHGGLSGKDGYEDNCAAPTVNKAKEKYLIREYSGKIGVFDLNGALIKALEVPTVTLTKEERMRLYSGFYVESDEELKKFIEDYSG